MQNIQLEERQRAVLLDRLYRRISALDDDSLVELDRWTIADIYADDTPEKSKRGLDRRKFLATLLLGSAAVVAGGGMAAALLSQTVGAGQVTFSEALGNASHPAPPIPTAGLPPELRLQIEALQAQLAEAQSERLALRAQLDAAQVEIGRLAGERDTLSVNQEVLSAEAEQARREADRLGQVVSLYEQMDAVGLDNVVAAGMGPLGMMLMGLQGGRLLLESGVQEAARLLATVEVQSPAIANGLLWLENQVAALSLLLQQLENALRDVLSPVEPITTQIGNFIGQIIDMLPFGVGQHIRAGLEAIGLILTHIPELVASINPMFLTPLRQWVSPDGDKGLVPEVVRPISANLVNPAQQVAESVSALETTYNDQLKTPVEQALVTRAQIRSMIADLTGLS